MRRLVFLAVPLAALFLMTGALVAAPGDQDSDGIPDASDNCPTVFNDDGPPGFQADSNKDGVGDACDPAPVGPNEIGLGVYVHNSNGSALVNSIGQHLRPCLHWKAFLQGTQIAEVGADVCQTTGWHWSSTDPSILPDRIDVTQISPPSGCAGGPTSTESVPFAPGQWKRLDFTYSCPNLTPPSSGGGGGAGGAKPVKFADTFSAAGQARPHQVVVPAKATRATITCRWANRKSRFDIVGLTNTAKTLLSVDGAGKLRPGKLKITKSATKTSVRVTVTKLRPGRLSFKVQAKSISGVGKTTTTVALK
jgi:thrombospondin type 3 repeat protein